MSQVNWGKPLTLATVLAVFGGAAYWYEYNLQPKKEKQEEESKKIFQIGVEKPVTQMKLIDGNRVYTFKCLDIDSKLCKVGDNSKWQLTEPSNLKADDSNVNALLTSLDNLASTETVDLSEDTPEKRGTLLKEYGLDSESRKLATTRRAEVTTPDGKVQTAFFGEPHPIGGNIFTFAGTDEKKVYLTPSYFKSHFDHDLTYWRNKKLFTLTTAEVSKFDLDGPKGKISGEKKDGQWTLKPDLAGDPENIDSMLSGATYLTARKFLTEYKHSPEGQKILKGTRRILTLRIARESDLAPKKEDRALASAVTLTLYEPKDKSDNSILATVDNLDPIFELDGGARNKVSKELKDLRQSKLISAAERFSARHLEFKGKLLGAEPLQLTQKDGRWTFVKDSSAAIDGEKVQNLLDKISGNRIKAFLQGSAIPKGEADGLTMTVSDEKREKVRELVFWKKDGKLYARDLKSKRAEVFLVDSAAQDALPWTRTFFEKSKVVVPAAAPSPAAAKH